MVRSVTSGNRQQVNGPDDPPPIRMLADEAMVVFISDTHMGGDPGTNSFEAHTELAALFEDLAAHPGPVELVLAGDIFDLLKIGTPPAGQDRASVTLARPEYATLLAAWRSFASGDERTVIYLPGNHDTEVWWNHDVQQTLRRAGLVDEFRLSYAARYSTFPDRLIYSEHGNQFDPANARLDYSQPAETPLGDHVAADIIRPLMPHISSYRGVSLEDLPRVHPLTLIPEWLAGRVFYGLVSGAVRWVFLPLLLAFLGLLAVVYLVASMSGDPADPSGVGALGPYRVVFDVLLVLIAFLVAIAVLRRTHESGNRFRRSIGRGDQRGDGVHGAPR